MEVGLGPGDFVLDGDPAPPSEKGKEPPQIFGPRLLWPNGWMDQDGTWHGSRPQPRWLCVRWGPSPTSKFSAHVYYSYCDFVKTLHNRYWFAQVQVLFLEKSLIVLSMCQYKYWSEYLSCGRLQWEQTEVESLNFSTMCHCDQRAKAALRGIIGCLTVTVPCVNWSHMVDR